MKIFDYLSEFMVPLLIFYIVSMGICAKRNVCEDFTRGAKEGLRLSVKLMPTMIAMLAAVNILRASGFLEFIAELLTPLAEQIHFPAPLLPLSIIKAFSGSGATGLLLDLFKQYGTDSNIGKIGSVMLSSTETIFYTMSLYFVTAGVRKTRYTLPGCLIATVIGIIMSVLTASLF